MSTGFTAKDPAHPTTAEIPFIYPTHWEADVVLRDGATAHLRPVIPTDRDALEQMYAGQSERTIYLRFFAPKPKLSDKELTRFTTVDHVDRVAFVLYRGEELLGIGRYDRTNDPTEAEVAFMISDKHQGRGIGSILLEHLAAAAHERGIQRFSAEVLPENRPMLNVFSDAGYEVTREFEDGIVLVEFDIDPTDRSREVMETREHRAEAQSISELLTPVTVAVLADSSNWDLGGKASVINLITGGYTGKIYAICPGKDSKQAPEGSVLVSDISQIQEQIDLAIITLPIEKVADAVEACGQAGTRGALILTSGYADDGARGRARQKALVRSARGYGMRIIGPASFGLLNNDPAIKLDATLTIKDPPPGSLGLFSQSAGIGAMFSQAAVRRNIGVSSLVSAGNRADVSGNDMMQYWEDDPHTRVCALYLESIGNPRKFGRIARRLSRSKPVIASKNQVTGRQLPPGHSGRTSTVPRDALDSMFRQAGVISVDSVDQVLDVAQLLVSMPLPKKRRIAIISNAAALGQMVADRAATRDIEVKLTESMLTLGKGSMNLLQEVFYTALESSDIDALIGVFLTEGVSDPQKIADRMLAAAQKFNKPSLAVFPAILEAQHTMHGIYGESDQKQEQEEGPSIAGLPCYSSPVQAVDALASVMDYVEWREKEAGTLYAPAGVRPKDTAAFINGLMSEVEGEELLELDQAASSHILAQYGINLLPSFVVEGVEQAYAAVEQVSGYPVVLKATDDFLSRRLDLGGIRLNIENKAQLEHEFLALTKTLSRYGNKQIALQKQVDAGQATVIEALEDPLLGPVISFGMSGDATSLLNDWARRIPPLTQRDIYKLVRSPKAAVRLFGENELAAVRVDLLEDLLARVALLKDNHPELAFIQLNPVIVAQQSLTVAMAKIKLGNPQQRTDSARRTLS